MVEELLGLAGASGALAGVAGEEAGALLAAFGEAAGAELQAALQGSPVAAVLARCDLRDIMDRDPALQARSPPSSLALNGPEAGPGPLLFSGRLDLAGGCRTSSAPPCHADGPARRARRLFQVSGRGRGGADASLPSPPSLYNLQLLSGEWGARGGWAGEGGSGEEELEAFFNLQVPAAPIQPTVPDQPAVPD
jgi:hypothetical protein